MKIFIMLFFLLIFESNILLSSNKNIILEEKEDMLLTGIRSIDFNSDGSKFLILDLSMKRVFQYESKSGKLLNNIYAGHYISNSFRDFKGKLNNYRGKKWEVLKWDKDGNKIDYERDKEEYKYINNTFKKLYYDDYDNIKIETSVNALIYGDLTEKVNMIYDTKLSLLTCNSKLGIENVLFFSSETNSYPMGLLNSSENHIFTKVMPATKLKKVNLLYSDLPIISEFDAHGEFISNIAYLPEFYQKNNIGYKYFENRPITTIRGDELIYAFPFENYIRFSGSSKEIKLQNIGKNNIKKMKTASDLLGEEINIVQRYNYFPVEIRNLFNYKNDLFVFVKVKIKENENNYYFLMQKYDINSGKLLREAKVNNIIKYQPFTMSKDCKYIYTTALEDENYVVRKHEVESLWEK